MEAYRDGLKSVAFSSDGKRLVSASCLGLRSILCDLMLDSSVQYRRIRILTALPDPGIPNTGFRRTYGKYPREGSNLQPSASEADALSN